MSNDPTRRNALAAAGIVLGGSIAAQGQACALSRAVPEDIHSCGKALAKAKRPRIHTGIGASDIHIMGKFRDDKYGRKLAKGYSDDVEFYAEDSGRSEPAYLFEMLEAVIDAGATVLNSPDTTGYSVPEQYGTLIRDIRAKVRNADRLRDARRLLPDGASLARSGLSTSQMTPSCPNTAVAKAENWDAARARPLG